MEWSILANDINDRIKDYYLIHKTLKFEIQI